MWQEHLHENFLELYNATGYKHQTSNWFIDISIKISELKTVLFFWHGENWLGPSTFHCVIPITHKSSNGFFQKIAYIRFCFHIVYCSNEKQLETTITLEWNAGLALSFRAFLTDQSGPITQWPIMASS